jgi:hypothetical protein
LESARFQVTLPAYPTPALKIEKIPGPVGITKKFTITQTRPRSTAESIPEISFCLQLGMRRRIGGEKVVEEQKGEKEE